MLFYFGHYGNQYILKLQAIHWKEIENSNRFMEPNPDDNPLMVDLLWSDPKGVLVTKGRLLFKEGKNVMVWVWSGCIHIYIYICTCFLLYVIMWISYPCISNSPCTDCLCAWTEMCWLSFSHSMKKGGSLPDVWYCLSHAPQWIPFKWVRFWKATENAVMARPLRCLGWAPTWREEMPSKHRTVDENICFWKPPHHQGSLCNIQVVWNGDESIDWFHHAFLRVLSYQIWRKLPYAVVWCLRQGRLWPLRTHVLWHLLAPGLKLFYRRHSCRGQ